jgi:hypothetical protein
MANPLGGLARSVLGLNFHGAPKDEHGDAIHSSQTARDLSNRIVKADEADRCWQLEN